MRLTFLLVLGAFLFLYRLGDRDLTSSHEARAAQNARAILSAGAWGLPRLLDRHIELQKPPLYYWLVAFFSGCEESQVGPWSVRLPAALSALGCVVFLYYLGWCRGRPRAGFLAALFLATSLHFTALGRVGRIDVPLAFATTLSLGGFFLGWCRRREGKRSWPWFFLSYVAVGLGLLLKGPIAAVLPAAAAGAFLLIDRRGAREKGRGARGEGRGIIGDQLATSSFLLAPRPSSLVSRPSPLAPRLATLWWGIPLVLAIAGPWFVWANIETDNQLWNVFIWYHNVQRGLGGSEVLHAHPPWFYFSRLLVDLFPWVLAWPAALWFFCKQQRWQTEPESRFGLIWFLTVLVLLSALRFKRADYLIPAYPGAALWQGFVADRWFQERKLLLSARSGWLRLVSPKALGMVVAGFAIAWLGYLEFIQPVQENGRPYRRFAQEIRQRTELPVIFFRAEAHELAFHVGPPLDTILEWENLDVWASSADTIYFVMPPECARQWPRYLDKGRLEHVMCSADLVERNRERPLVLMRSVPRSEKNP